MWIIQPWVGRGRGASIDSSEVRTDSVLWQYTASVDARATCASRPFFTGAEPLVLALFHPLLTEGYSVLLRFPSQMGNFGWSCSLDSDFFYLGSFHCPCRQCCSRYCSAEGRARISRAENLLCVRSFVVTLLVAQHPLLFSPSLAKTTSWVVLNLSPLETKTG